jgi:hypothetical protein
MLTESSFSSRHGTGEDRIDRCQSPCAPPHCAVGRPYHPSEGRRSGTGIKAQILTCHHRDSSTNRFRAARPCFLMRWRSHPIFHLTGRSFFYSDCTQENPCQTVPSPKGNSVIIIHILPADPNIGMRRVLLVFRIFLDWSRS